MTKQVQHLRKYRSGKVRAVNIGTTKTITLIPYDYWSWGVSKMVYVDKDNKHPDPLHKLLWGYDENGDFVEGDYIASFERKGSPIVIKYNPPRMSTASAEKSYRTDVIINFLKKGKN